MKRVKTISTLLLVSFFLNTHAQTDQKAKVILDQLSAKTKTYSSIKADFNYILENKAEGLNEVQSGMVVMKGDKYRLKIAGQEIFCDGQTIWTYLKDAQEIQISEVDPDNEDQITPKSLFTMYEKGFRHEYKKEETTDGIDYAIINIYPLDLDEKSYHTIKLYIDRNKIELKKAVILSKEGDVYTYKIKSFQPNFSLSDTDFVLDVNKYPAAEVVDLR